MSTSSAPWFRMTRRFSPPATAHAPRSRKDLPHWSGFTVNARPLKKGLTAIGAAPATARSAGARHHKKR